MDRTTRQLAGDIKAGRNLEQALPELMNRMASAYGMLSYYNMNMELSVLLGSKEDGLIKPGRTVKELEEKLYHAIFFQRKLKSSKGLIGKCRIYPERRRCSFAASP